MNEFRDIKIGPSLVERTVVTIIWAHGCRGLQRFQTAYHSSSLSFTHVGQPCQFKHSSDFKSFKCKKMRKNSIQYSIHSTQRACHNSLPEEMMEPWINETVFIIVKKHKVIPTGDEDIKDDRDPTKTDSTDLDSNTWGNKLNYETHLDDMNTIRQRKKRSHGAHGEEKHNKHSPGV